MKKIIVTLVIALFALFATAAFAQANFVLRADVPFSFSVDGRHYDAGYYELRTLNNTTFNNSIVRLVNIDTGEVSLIRLIPVEQASIWNTEPPKLRFVVSGESFHLVSLVDGYGNGWQVPVMFERRGTALAASHKPS